MLSQVQWLSSTVINPLKWFKLIFLQIYIMKTVIIYICTNMNRIVFFNNSKLLKVGSQKLTRRWGVLQEIVFNESFLKARGQLIFFIVKPRSARLAEKLCRPRLSLRRKFIFNITVHLYITDRSRQANECLLPTGTRLFNNSAILSPSEVNIHACNDAEATFPRRFPWLRR